MNSRYFFEDGSLGLIYDEDKVLELVKRTDRIADVVEEISRSENLEEVSSSVLEKVFEHYVVGNSKIEKVYMEL